MYFPTTSHDHLTINSTVSGSRHQCKIVIRNIKLYLTVQWKLLLEKFDLSPFLYHTINENLYLPVRVNSRMTNDCKNGLVSIIFVVGFVLFLKILTGSLGNRGTGKQWSLDGICDRALKVFQKRNLYSTWNCFNKYIF